MASSYIWENMPITLFHFLDLWKSKKSKLYLFRGIEKAMENIDAKKEGRALQETIAKTKLNEA